MIFDKAGFQIFLNALKQNGADNSHLISYTQEISEEYFNDLVSCFIDEQRQYFYWSTPWNGFSFLSVDEIFCVTGSSLDALSHLDQETEKISKKILTNRTPGESGDYPMFVGAIKFSGKETNSDWKDFNFTKWFIPKFLIYRKAEQITFTVNAFFEDASRIDFCEFVQRQIDSCLELLTNPTLEPAIKIKRPVDDGEIKSWTKKINSALSNISNGYLEKVVLARCVESELSSYPSLISILRNLEKNFQNCYTFAYRSGDSVFFGSSPEKLLKTANGILETDALAGSSRRGTTENDDAELENQLLHDAKNLSEQKNVFDFILDKLTNVTDEISFSSNPAVKKFSNIQHIYTNIRAKLKPGISIFTLIKNLHPTPAVCGLPSSSALKIIEEIEEFDRGLYSGAIGWFNSNGSCELAVGIRSALLIDKKLSAFAGCGIVKGSDPLSEFEETELKLNPILSLFENEIIR